ncbi:penicillin-binding transpeptidase domain-containing protein [Ethanoligenens harbinense]|nr:penicillin-binding transpeptidase domain-containing protein [Ethanoligenens harbinense]AVQ96619.1 PASTA domain-containing protein [Ethanoligenens harbinense YUAN-3]AYF39280.1 PASTA domain-containing protein [Ethanoligenens harbinense]AYF42104.1 PASTA domain-containing protein [Ethanoligenens harbinense]QCN92859.1 PASTA domain-containing protein [Ethanoligenens harbinense]
MARGPGFSMKKKMLVILFGFFALGFAVLIVRLFILQVLDGPFYAQRAARQQLATVRISANRGSILDRNGKPLAQSATVWDVTVSPSYIKTDAERNKTADALSRILAIDRQTLYNKINQRISYVVVAKRIEKPTQELVADYIRENNIGYIGLVEDSKRYYPYGNFAGQVLGFTGTDDQGLAGVEAQYNSVLKGTSGKLVTAKNAHGTDMPYNYSAYEPPTDGDNVVLTIDEVVQHALENNLQQAVADNNVTNRVAAIAMNVNTGEILGMATEPGFDPNDPYTIADPAAQKTLAGLSGDALGQATANARQAQWRNKAITEPYEPGSVFKTITAASAIDAGVVKATDLFSDPGSIKVAGTTFHDWKAGGSGTVTFLQGFEQSINVVFIQVGQRLGVANFYKYLSNFGLTTKTGIDLPGEALSITIPEKRYGPVELASASFGQSNKFTPVEMITAIAAVSNGGKLVQPHIVKEITDPSGKVIKTFGTTVKKQVMTPEASKEMDRILQLEVTEGSGKNAYVAGYRIGGKTGTAQKLDVADSTARIASFCGVAPCDDPQVAVLLLMDEPHNTTSNYGGVIAAPVVGTIFSQILPYLGVQPQYTPEELAKVEVQAPNAVGRKAADAAQQFTAAGLNVQMVGGGDTVTAQMPAAGEMVPKGGSVVLYTGGAQPASTAVVPNLIGQTPEQVNAAMAAAHLNVNFTGLAQDATGETAYAQSQPVGAQVPPGTVVEVRFRDSTVKDDVIPSQ